MKILFTISFLLSTLILYSQYEIIPSKNSFYKIKKNYKPDTLKLGNYNIVKIQYDKTYEVSNEVYSKFTEIIYLINDSIIIKSYTCKDDFAIERRKSNLFLLPDSSLGIVNYAYDNAYANGANGACGYDYMNIYNIRKDLTYYKFLGINFPLCQFGILINGKAIFGRDESYQLPNSNFILKRKNEESELVKIIPRINKAGDKLILRLISTDINDNSTEVDLPIKFIKTKNRFTFTYLKPIER